MIRKVVRNLPETNSSSSHSLIIDTVEINLVGKDEIPIENGIIHLKFNYGDFDRFGRSYEKFNDTRSKLLYACSLIHSIFDYDVGKAFKKLNILKTCLINFTGAKDVVFDWIIDFYSNLRELKKNKDSDLAFINGENFDITLVDHQSTDKYYEIFETPDTLKNFLFNKNSWVFVTDECFKIPVKEYNVKNLPNETQGGYFIIHIGGDIGDIHYEFEEYPVNPEKYLRGGLFGIEYRPGDIHDILSSIYFDVSGSRVLKYSNYNKTLVFRGLMSGKLCWSTRGWKKAYGEELYSNPNVSEEDRIKEINKLYPNECLTKDFEIYSNEFGIVF